MAGTTATCQYARTWALPDLKQYKLASTKFKKKCLLTISAVLIIDHL